MRKFFTRFSQKKVGAPPGTLVHAGEKKAQKIKISYLDYNAASCNEKVAKNVEELFPFRDSSTVTWINIDGLHDVSTIEKIGQYFGMHPLILEDILSVGQHPKLEEFDTYLFAVMNVLTYDDKKNEINGEQFSLVVGKNYVISFQETEGDIFNAIRERLRTGKGRVREAGPDYLAYSLIDTIVDHYFVILEKLGDYIEDLETDLLKDPGDAIFQKISHLKKEMLFLRKSVWPLRELIGGMQRLETPLIKKTTRLFLKDVYDHTIQVIDTTESFRDVIAGMVDSYLSSMSNRTNEIMKVLTVFASIFIPLTFVTGVYGMNFRYLPELEWQWGYAAFWTIVVLMVGVMLFYFKRKKWL